MKFTKNFLAILAAVAALSMTAIAADQPNFSGDWKLNVDKSTFGEIPPPASGTRTIDHQGTSLSYDVTQSGGTGDQAYTVKLTTNGKETAGDLMGNPAKYAANWDGSTLVIDEKVDFQGNEIAIKDIWTLSEDGKKLTSAAHIVAPQGEFDMTLVFDKQ